MELKELRATLLRIDHPEKVLELADTYLKHMKEAGDAFVLPKEHALVKPILEYYVDDLDGWVRFVKGVRDRLPKLGRAYHEGVNRLYRKLEVRLSQQEIRALLTPAVEVAVRKGLIDNDYESKKRYANRCQQEWKMKRQTLRKNMIRASGRSKISSEEQAALFAEFWKNIAEAIKNGEVPKP